MSGTLGVVTTAFPAASEAGREALAAGGNAVDAAVAAAWALAVCEPSGSGLGGQTVMILRLAGGRKLAIDGHSRAPAGVSRRGMTRAEQRAGYRASTVPTTPAVLAYVHERYGLLSHAAVLQPALRLAEDGYVITRLQSRQLRWCAPALAQTEAAARYLSHGERPYRPGERFCQPHLAAALRRILEHGAEDFYEGAIARAIAREMARNGGLLSAADLAGARPLAEREPISIAYRGHEVLTIPPPGGGVELLFALRLRERFAARGEELDHWYSSLADATHAAFTERERDPIHPASWTDALGDELLGDERAGRLTLGIRGPLPVGADAEEPGETTHLCAADAAGNVVSLTQSIQSLFGAKVANDAYGFLYNNYLTTCPRRRHPYRLAAGGLVRSNAAPTLVLDHGQPRLALGAAGSRRIVSSLLHVLSAVLDRKLGLADAVEAPRIHARLSGKIWLERPAATRGLCEALRERFREVELKPRHSYCMGAVHALALPDDGPIVGVADPRRDGAVEGWSGR